MEYARKELPDPDGDPWQQLINENILELVRVFSDQGHSETSGAYVRRALDKLLDWKPLSLLTGEEDEWSSHSEYDGVQQNNRCYSVFRGSDGGAYHAKGYVFHEPAGGGFSCRLS